MPLNMALLIQSRWFMVGTLFKQRLFQPTHPYVGSGGPNKKNHTVLMQFDVKSHLPLCGAHVIG